MKKANSCIICNSQNLKKYNAIVVPFIADRIFNKKNFHTWLLKCKSCDMEFFDLRFDDDEMKRLYSDYRDENYIQLRNKYEPWYTKKLNNSLFAKSKTWNVRQTSLIKMATDYEPDIESRIKSILDFGGDKGQLISGIFNQTKKYVFEISNVELLPGIEKAEYPSMVKYDFIVCSNVFEHVPYPQESVRIMYEMGNEQSVLYLEVPDERPYSIFTLTKRMAQQMLLLLLRPKLFLSMLKPGMLTHMHEHINYFSTKSVRYLLENTGYKDIKIKKEIINGSRFLCAFAHK